MARKRNYNTDQLKKYVDEYVRQKNDYSSITPTALAEYCNTTLHLLPAVTYQTFTRDKDVLSYIEHINTKLHEGMLIPLTKGASVFIDSIYIDNIADVEEVRNKAYEELEKRDDLIRELQFEYSKCSKELDVTIREKEALLEINKTLSLTVTDQKKEISLLKKQLKEKKTLLATYREYFRKYLYDPIVLRHVAQLGWVSDRKDAVMRCDINTDIISEIGSLYKKSELYINKPVSSDTGSSDAQPLMSPESERIDLVNSDSAAFLSQLRSL